MHPSDKSTLLHHPTPIRLLLGMVEELGLDPQRLLKSSGASLEMIADTRPLSWHTAVAIYGNAANLTEIPDLALDAGTRLGLKEVGPLGYAQYVAPTTREAIQLSHLHQSVLQPFLNIEYAFSDDTLTISWAPALPLVQAERFIVELCMASGQRAAEDLMAPIAVRPLLVEFSFGPRGNLDRYREVFKTDRLMFNAPGNRITFPSSGIDLPKFSHDPIVLSEMKNVIRSMANRLSREPDIVEEMMALLVSSPGEFPSAEEVAAALDMSVRTLRRKLVAAGTTYQAMLDKTRSDLAREYLQQSQFNVQQIAELCGFTESQNFSLAFKRWTGMSPSLYRSIFKAGDDKDSVS
jgi:AraC-like DNA-binding protein